MSTSPSAAPAKPITGKLNSNLPGIPHKLEWGCDPSELANWFIRWKLWWGAAYLGPPNPSQLISMVRMYLSDEWMRLLAAIDWDEIEIDGLHVIMDKKLEIRFPPLKRTVKLFTELKLSNSESPSQFFERCGREMKTGGIGQQPNIVLSWDRLLVVLCVKGLPSHLQIELLKKYDTIECSVDDLLRFLDTLSTSKALGGVVNKIGSKGPAKKKPALRPTANMSSGT